MEILGAQLKAAREQKHVTLSQAARDTRISANHLENLEMGRYQSLPGGMYNRAFLRTYCAYLGLDPQGMLDRYEAETSTPTERMPSGGSARPHAAEYRFAPHPVLLWSVMLFVSVVALYFSRGWISNVFSPYFTNRPAATPPLLNPGEKAAPPAQGPTAQAAGGAEPSDATSPASEASLPPQAPGTIRLRLQITQRCWVSVTSDGTRVLVKLLEPGDAPTFDAAESLYLILGNAGGVRATINGKPAKPFGLNGEVVKISINPQNVNELLE